MKHPAVVFGLCIVAVAVGAFAIRLPRLAQRPMHPDEANEAARAGILFDTGQYRYDSKDHHGPSLYYLTLPSLAAGGAARFADTTESDYRIVPVLFGVGLVLLLALAGDGLGRPAAVVAGILAAISPAMVFYSRYYIQETLLVFFTLGTIVAAWRFVQSGRTGWAVAAGLAFGLMVATKETWVLAAAAMIVAVVLTVLWGWWREGRPAPERPPATARRAVVPGWIRPWPLALAVAVAVVVAAVLYSSFGTNPTGLWDAVRAYGSYAEKAGGELHRHPWYFYLSMLVLDRPARGFVWSEGLIVGLAAVGLVAALTRKSGKGSDLALLRFLGFYTVALTALYAAIPYKTPWCALGFLHGMTLMAGVGAVTLVRWMPCRWSQAAVCVVLAGLAAHLGWESYRLNFRLYADQRNPYVYAHASTDVLNLARHVNRLAQASPAGRDLLVKVISSENPWPLPWYLRKFDRVGWWRIGMPDGADAARGWYAAVPDDPDADVVIATTDLQAELDKRLRGSYNKQGIYGLRPGVLVMVYVDERLWDAFQLQQAGPTTAPGEASGSP
jgi:uncharacterized protein (TIGR03663 family)